MFRFRKKEKNKGYRKKQRKEKTKRLKNNDSGLGCRSFKEENIEDK